MLFYSWLSKKSYSELMGQAVSLAAYSGDDHGLSKRVASVFAELLFQDGIILELDGRGFEIKNGGCCYTLKGVLTPTNHHVYVIKKDY